jgi:hypothetical protein
MRSLKTLTSLILATGLIFSLSGWSQEHPYTQEQVSNMVRAGLGDDFGAKLIGERGITFAAPEDFLQRLKAAGASEAFLNAVRAAKRLSPLSEATPTDISDARRMATELANPSSLVSIQAGERLPDEELSRIAAHNRDLCDQTITVAALTPRGLVLYVPLEGHRFMAKNSQNYPRMCLLEDATNVIPGVPHYLLAYAYSENAFAGFQPVTRVNTTTAPVSGSGTITSAYGDMWNFTYYGTVKTTEIDTIEAPYVIQSHSIFLNAYNESGKLVSHHSLSVSSQIGGNETSAAVYNGIELIALLWNNPSHLIKSVLKDVQKDSKKYSQN